MSSFFYMFFKKMLEIRQGIPNVLAAQPRSIIGKVLMRC